MIRMGREILYLRNNEIRFVTNLLDIGRHFVRVVYAQVFFLDLKHTNPVQMFPKGEGSLQKKKSLDLKSGVIT